MPRKRRDLERPPPRLLAVEGPLGTGKTAVVEAWSARVGAESIVDRADDNPFLADVFRQPERRAFPAQLCFLLARYEQQAGLRQGDLFSHRTVVDYVFQKDRLYAEALLSGAEFALYERIYRLLEPSSAVPDLLVFLRARPDRLLARLRARGRAHERAMGLDLMTRLCTLYARFFERWRNCPILTLDVSEVDLYERDDLLDEVFATIQRPPSELWAVGRSELRLPGRG